MNPTNQSDPQSAGTPLTEQNCVPCEGLTDPMTLQAATAAMADLPDWTLAEDHRSIHRKFNTGNFMAAVQKIGQIAEIAESQQHHPDLHLTGYRHLRVVLTTHAIGGLSQNDFILAARIDVQIAPRGS